MNIWGVLKIIGRRFYIVVPIFAAGCVLAYTHGKQVAPSYRAQAYVTLQGPTAANQAIAGLPGQTQQVQLNPLLNSDDGLLAPESARLILAEASNKARQDAVAAGVDPGYSIIQPSGKSAVMIVESNTPNQRLSLATVQFGINHLTVDLNAEQQGFLSNPTQRVTLQTVIPPETTGVATAGKRKVEIVIGSAGAIVAILLALLVEALAIALRKRRPSRRHEAPQALPDRAPVAAQPPVLQGAGGPEPRDGRDVLPSSESAARAAPAIHD
jgi:uncharacterized iron-regulated membrane protein